MVSDPRAESGVGRTQPERTEAERQKEKIAHGQLPKPEGAVQYLRRAQRRETDFSDAA
jgi:hypothetical protein